MRTAVLILLLALPPTSAAAQARWAVVRAGTGDATDAEAAARRVLVDALGGTGIAIHDDTEAATRVEDYHSVEPGAVESDRIEELRAAVTSLEEHAALQHREAARAEAERIRALSEGLSSDLAEQTEVAERLFAACVAEAWLHIQLREREEARHILQQCRELHPDVAINPVTVAPPVVEMLRAIDAELSRRPTFALTCAGVPDGCELRMDGRRRAVAPEPISGIVPGAHRLELVCEGMRRRRVHRVIVGAENRTLPFDPRFDDVLLTRPPAAGASAEVRLDYPSEADAREHRVADAVTVAGVLEASVIVLATRETRGYRFDRIDVADARVTASVIVDPASFVGAAVLRAATAILEQESVDLSGPEAVAIRAWPAGETDAARDASIEEPVRAAGPGPNVVPIVGVVLGAVGLGAYGGAWGTYSGAYDATQSMLALTPGTPMHVDQRGQRDTLAIASYGLGLGGAALVTASLPLFLPETPGEVPWWSLVIGGVGIVPVVLGAIQLEANDRLVRNDTPGVFYDTELPATLWFAAAVPFLSVPLVYLIRLVTSPAASASAAVELTPERLVVRVGASF